MKKGFTLVELIAVITILALITVVGITFLMGNINSKKTDISDAMKDVLYTANQLFIQDKNVYPLTNGNVYCTQIIELKNKNLLDKDLKDPLTNDDIAEDIYVRTIVIDNTYTYDLQETCSEVRVDKDLILNGTDPVLTDSLIPVIIAEDGTVTKADLNNTWYDYSNKQWANAVVVSTGTSNYYKNADAKTVIEKDNIVAYYVWIPRYEYKIFDTNTSTNDSSNLNSIKAQGGIDIRFTTSGSTMPVSPTLNEYYTHPAFSVLNEDGTKTELNGFWVAKFELTPNSKIIPNTTALVNQTINQFYTTIDSFETLYNLINLDSHMMKNIEWGAVAYLTYSSYGTCSTNSCTEITANTSNLQTGGGDYINNTNQSTTGNITGIYDMSGGAWEFVMGVMKDSSNLNIYYNNSGFDTETMPETQYFDTYNYGTTYNDTTAYARGKYGDATKETTAWELDYSYFVGSNSPWFIRGGHYSSSNSAGIFAFYYNGVANSDYSARAVLWNK